MKRTISALLTLAVLAATACGSGGETDVTTSTTQCDTTTEAASLSEYAKPDADYNGKTFTVASFRFDMPYVIARYTMISHEEETGDSLSDAIISMTRKVEDDLGVKLELYELTNDDRNSIDKLNRIITAGDDEVQAAFPLTTALTKLLGNPSLLTDLKSVPTLDLSHSWWDEKSVEEYTIGGKSYAAIGDICLYMKCAPIVNFFNKKLLSENKLEDPYKLVEDGKWTTDRLMEMSRAAASDLNGNQQVDPEEDVFGFMCENSTLRYILDGAGVDYSRGKDDKIEITFYSDKAASIVEKLVPFIRDKQTTLFAGDFYGKYSSPFTELMQPAFMNNRVLFYSNQLLQALDFRAMDADFGILPLPKADESQDGYYSTTNTWWRDNLVIPATNGDLEMTGYVLDAMGYYSQQLITPAFIDTTINGKSIRDTESGEMVRLIYETQVYDIAMLFDWGGVYTMVDSMLGSASTNLASEYAAKKESIVSAMKQTMETILDNQ